MNVKGAESLLRAAVEIFGERGLAGASTREIAQAAGVPMSLITYHFGGKEGLYLATADYIAGLISDYHGPQLAALAVDPPQTAAQAVDRLASLVDEFAQLMLAPQSAAWARFIVREQQQPTAAFERLFERIMGPMMAQVLGVIARARPDLDERQRGALMALIYGQTLILRVGRASICRLFGTAAIDEALGNMLRTALRSSLHALIKEYRP